MLLVCKVGATKFLQLCIYLSLDLFLPIILHIPFDALNPFRHYLLISYMLLPDVGIWCNRALCVETAHSTYFTATSLLFLSFLCLPYILTIFLENFYSFLVYTVYYYIYSILYMSYVRYDSDKLSLSYVYGTVRTTCAGFAHLLFAVQCQCASQCVRHSWHSTCYRGALNQNGLDDMAHSLVSVCAIYSILLKLAHLSYR